ncbi:MAG: HNH endonuclease [Prevotella sp.]|nr:HNH endonuclease [Prevotella sp.]
MAKHGTLYTKWIQSREWYAGLRIQVLREQQGLCAWCKAKGYIVPATVVHHMIEVESGKTEAEQRRLMFSRSNCVGLCRECHNEYHKQQGYHSTEAVRQRQTERHEAWQDAMEKRFKGPSTEGDPSTS